ncbi:MAG: cysteine desulfurase [Bacillota bacterium]|nr:cysteine desulfurase [Bacillota bacterium]
MHIYNIKKDFPILDRKIGEKSLIYLDNAATTQKPLQVLNAMEDYNKKFNGNPHRGAHYLSVMATEVYEGARDKVRNFIGAKKSKEIIFTKNATEALNLIAFSYGMNFIDKEDEIVVLISEHHSNILPWQMIASAKGAVLKYIYLKEDGTLSLDEVKSKITNRTKLVSLAQMSNVLGVINPVKEVAQYAHSKGAVVVVDGAQSVPHMKVDVTDLDADFLVFSAHKMLGPMGIGVLYGKEEILDKMPPFLRGGDMIEYVTEQSSTFAELPFKFEAGTQNVEGAVGLSAAIDYINNIGMEEITKTEKEITAYALSRLAEVPYVTIYGPTSTEQKGGIISFNIEGVHPHDVSSIVDAYGVAIRAGHHCAQPLMKYLNIPASCRASFYFYNTKEEIDKFIESIEGVRKWLGYGTA